MLIHNPIITGSLIVSGSILSTEGINAETGSLLVSASGNDGAVISFIYGDGSSFELEVNNIESSSYAESSSFVDILNVGGFTDISQSLSFRIDVNEGDIDDLINNSGSFSDRLVPLEDASGSFANDSGSFSIRVSTNETNIGNLQTDSGSFSIRVTDLEGASGSFSTRVSDNETNIGNLQTDSGSFSTRITNLKSDSGSFSTRVSTNETNIGGLQTDSSSFSDRIIILEDASGSFANDSGSFSLRISANSSSIAVINNNTSSYARTDQSNNFGGIQTFASGGFTLLTAESASFGYIQSISGSAKIIGDSFIILNNDTPTQRFAGVAVYDSGSVGVTASFQFDGQTNDWFYEYSDDGGATTDHGVVMFGPEYNTKGSPTYPTSNKVLKGSGTHHVAESNITDNGSLISLNSNTQVTGSLNISGGTTGSFTGSFTGNGSNLTGLPPGYSVSNSSNNRIVTSVNSTSGNAEANLTFDGTSLNVTGGVTASAGFTGSFTGDGSNLTGLPPGYTVTNSSNNRIVTSVNSTSGNAETNLTFDGTSLNVTGGVTASAGFTGSFTGDGSNLTGLPPGYSVSNSSNNRVITSVNSTSGNAETNLTFDGSTLGVTGRVTATSFTGSLLGNASSSDSATSATTATRASFMQSFDTRNNSSTPETYSAVCGIHFDFKLNSTNGLSDGGSYNGVMYWRKYGGGSDWTGGGAKEIAYTDNGNLWHRYGTGTSWGSWRQIVDSSNISSYSVGSATNATNACNFNVIADNTTNATHYLIFTGGSTGNQTPNSDTALTYNPSSNLLSAGCFVETSTLRCKSNIQVLSSPLEKIKQLKPVTFDWKNTGKNDIGFIAEEVKEVLPNLIHYNERGEIEGMNYSKITSLLVASIQEQQKQIDKLKEEIEEIKNKI
jgi:hypothetical protein